MESVINQYMEQRYKEYTLHRLKTRSVKRDNGCIEWQGAKTKQGYGTINISENPNKTKTVYCHRLAWIIANDRDLSRQEYVCHSCDNPSCINIDHLFVGSALDNSRDMAEKGRARTRPSETKRTIADGRKAPAKHNRVRVYTNEQIEAIRNSSLSLAATAALHGVSMSYVSKLRNGKAKTLILF